MKCLVKETERQQSQRQASIDSLYLSLTEETSFSLTLLTRLTFHNATTGFPREMTSEKQVQKLGTLRSNDADDNENVKKTIGLISKTTTSHVHHTFLYISIPFLHDYDVKMPNLAFCGGRKQATTKFYFSF